MNNFSFSHNVFRRLASQICKNQGLFSKGLRPKAFLRMVCEYGHSCLKKSAVVFHIILHLTLSSIYTHFNTLKKKDFRKTLWKKVKLLKMSNFTFFHNVFYAICILNSFNNHISVVVCSFFEFRTVSKWFIREWVKQP